jgi:carboxyl-terminal processing protease
LLQAGIELEKNREWIGAIQHYELATRAYPADGELKRRLLISRLHYDVVRRSSDSAIASLIERISPTEALDLYAEILARLETSYVEPLAMTEIVRGGTAYLEVAMTEPGFVQTHLRNQSPEAIERFRTSIHRVTLSRNVANRFEARSIVANAAKVAEQSLNLNPTATILQFVFGAVGLLDPYSSFLSSAELNEVESQIEGNFVGLGIALQPHEAPLRIINVIPGGPALDAGLQAGDLIIEIGSSRCEEVGAERAADLLRGPEKSHVRLLVQKRDGSLVDLVVSRRRVEVPSIEDVELLDSAAGIAYLKISSFQKTTAKELDDALWNLHRQGMQSLIIDVRGNPGGWLDASVAVADRFLTEGGIVSTRGKNGIENQIYSASRSGTWQVPLVLLIDGESASASEILAGAIRDNGRGVLVGQTTYGKGSVQGLFHTKSLSSGVRLTVSKFYSPSGRAISEQGVQPNVAVFSDEPAHFVAKPLSGTAAAPANPPPQDKALQVAIEQARASRLTAAISRN